MSALLPPVPGCSLRLSMLALLLPALALTACTAPATRGDAGDGSTPGDATREPDAISAHLWNPMSDLAPTISGTVSAAAPNYSVTGLVHDSASGALLAAASIELGGVTVMSGADGSFSATVPSGALAVSATLSGYLRFELATAVDSPLQLEIRLVPEGNAAMIGPAGGHIDHGGMRVDFPPGAFASPTQVRVTAMNARDARSIPQGHNYVDPDGMRAWLVFGAVNVELATEPAVPAHVFLPVPHGINPGRITLRLTDASGARAERLSPIAQRGRWVEFVAPHFSPGVEEIDFPGPSAPPSTPPTAPPVSDPPADLPPAPAQYDQPATTSYFPDGSAHEDLRQVTGQVLSEGATIAVPSEGGVARMTPIAPGTAVHAGDVVTSPAYTLEGDDGTNVRVQNAPPTVLTAESDFAPSLVAVNHGPETATSIATAIAAEEAAPDTVTSGSPPARVVLARTVDGMLDTVADMLAWGAVQVAAPIVIEYRRVNAAVNRGRAFWRSLGVAIDDNGTAFTYRQTACNNDPSPMARALFEATVATGDIHIHVANSAQLIDVSAGSTFDGCTGDHCDPMHPVCCDVTNCAMGCCQHLPWASVTASVCMPGSSSAACGAMGAMCQDCGGAPCSMQQCVDCRPVDSPCGSTGPMCPMGWSCIADPFSPGNLNCHNDLCP